MGAVRNVSLRRRFISHPHPTPLPSSPLPFLHYIEQTPRRSVRGETSAGGGERSVRPHRLSVARLCGKRVCFHASRVDRDARRGGGAAVFHDQQGGQCQSEKDYCKQAQRICFFFLVFFSSLCCFLYVSVFFSAFSCNCIMQKKKCILWLCVFVFFCVCCLCCYAFFSLIIPLIGESSSMSAISLSRCPLFRRIFHPRGLLSSPPPRRRRRRPYS